jgi:NTP pyrophosphatase (non-canonical NTP hydrolase)
MGNELKHLFNEISILSKDDYAGHAERMCKLAEEFGELAQAVNMTIGRKDGKLSNNQKRANITEEGADVLQNLICLLIGYGIDAETLLKKLSEKNRKWEKVMKKRNKKL